MKRAHYPGEEWCYCKLYGSVMAIEEWLVTEMPGLLKRIVSQDWIDNWYFIRFLDPDFHLRLRVKLKKPELLGIFLPALQQTLVSYLEERRIWKWETGTYIPEIERYGESRIHLAEAWFEADSTFWLACLPNLMENDQDDTRWMLAMVSTYLLFKDFDLPNSVVSEIITRMRKGLSAEFHENRDLKNQLDHKYRHLSEKISKWMEDGWKNSRFSELLDERSRASKPIISHLIPTFVLQDDLIRSNLLPNFIHMSMNRGFRSKHRLQEFVLYDFLGRWMKTQIMKGGLVN